MSTPVREIDCSITFEKKLTGFSKDALTIMLATCIQETEHDQTLATLKNLEELVNVFELEEKVPPFHLLAEFYRSADFEAFSEAMDYVLPHTGQKYREGKFRVFQENFSFWLCELEKERLALLEEYLINKQKTGAPESTPKQPVSTDEPN